MSIVSLSKQKKFEINNGMVVIKMMIMMMIVSLSALKPTGSFLMIQLLEKSHFSCLLFILFTDNHYNLDFFCRSILD